MAYEHLIGRPFLKSAKELVHHREGQGTRHVFINQRNIPTTSLYQIVRDVENATEDITSHVGMHAHNCPSTFLFIGKGHDLRGLICEVTLGDERYMLESPASVFIPGGVLHSYRFIGGSGYFVNTLLSPDYNSSIVTP